MSYKWDCRFMSVAQEIAKWSTCLRRQVGAVIVRDNRILATGFNGAPSGIEDCTSRNACRKEQFNCKSGTSPNLCYATHAEENALLQAARIGVSVKGSTIYTTLQPCAMCAKSLINAGIRKVVYLEKYEDEFAYNLLYLANIPVEQFKYKADINFLFEDYEKTLEGRVLFFNTLMEQAKIEVDINDLIDKGYFTAPASTKFHLCYEGGLFDHHVNVARNLIDLTKKMNLTWQKLRSPLLVGIFHDLCKCDQYKLLDGVYVWNKDADPLHGIKSAEMAKKMFADLTDEEFACIRHHMGAFNDKTEWSGFSKACDEFENVMWTHQADMLATHVNEK